MDIKGRRERFIPDRELETVEIDVKNKKFLVNGRDFGKDATSRRLLLSEGLDSLSFAERGIS